MVGTMIDLVTGTLGGGKSYYATREAVRHLQHGKMVVSNFDFSHDFFWEIARRTWRFRSEAYIAAKAIDMERRYRRIRTFQELTELRVRPEKPYARQGPDGRWVVKESSCIVLLDEVHRWMNARTWAHKNRSELLDFFAMCRHYGLSIKLITQRDKNLDVQVRELYENHIVIKNLRYSARFLGIRVCPWDIFVAGTFSHHEVQKRGTREVPQRTQLYGRRKWMSNLYDSMDTGSFGDTDPDAEIADAPRLWMPTAPETRTEDNQAREDSRSEAAALVTPAVAGVVAPEGGGWSDPSYSGTPTDPSL